MYTSQDSTVYADAAKASGADAVLPKQMSSADISDALHRLKVLTPKVAAPIEDATASIVPPSPVVPSLTAADVRAAVEPMVREQAGELRRAVTAAIDGIPARVTAEVSAQLDAAVSELLRTLTPPPPVPPPRPWGLIAALNVAIVVAAVLGFFFWRSTEDVSHLRMTIDKQATALAASPVAAADSTAPNRWPSERHPLGYGEAPFSAARIAQAGHWLDTLEQGGFVGSVRIVVSLADYCLTGNPGEGFALAPAEMVAAKCDLRGSPSDDARTSAEREPAALNALLKDVTARTHAEIEARLVYTKASSYPSEGAPAGQWNAAADHGHYVEFVAQPRMP
jgi:hypothetical protein